MALHDALLAGERWQRVVLLCALSALLVLSVGWLAVGLSAELKGNLERSQQLEQTGNLVRRLQQAVVDLESGQRGYLLTGDTGYLQPYQAAMTQLPALQSQLASQINDVAAKQLLADIRYLCNAKISELEQSLALLRERGREAALEFMRTDVGKGLMEQIRNQSENLIRLLQAELAQLRLAVPALVQQRDNTLLAVLALGLIAGGAAFWSLRRHLALLRREVELREQARRALRENDEKSLFLANLSHEIRTPMNAIFGFTQLLAELVEGARAQYYVQAIQASGQALLDLINDILDVSKIAAGKLELRPAPTDLRELAVLLNTMFVPQVETKGLQLSFVIDPRLPSALVMDPTRMRQVLFNLIGNAIRYTDRGSVKVEVSLIGADAESSLVDFELSVRDTGIGIAPADQERIFEPFTQLEPHSMTHRGGTGLGLAIVRRLVKLMGGTVTVESAPGVGSTFRLGFVRIPVSSELPEEPSVEARLADLPPLRILAVDDVELNRKLFQSLFERSPHQLECASSGAEGVALARAHKPDVVLMDIRMPEIDGRAALMQIRADPDCNGIRVIAVTASSMDDEESSLRRMFDGYVRKPLSRQTLHAELSRLFPVPGATTVAPVTAVRSTSEPLRALTAIEAAALQPGLDALSRTLQAAIATQASLDVGRCVHQVRLLAEQLVNLGVLNNVRAQLLQLAEQIQQSAALFDLAALAQQLNALARIQQVLQQPVTET